MTAEYRCVLLLCLALSGCSYKGDGHDCRRAVADMRGAGGCLNEVECVGTDALRGQQLRERWHYAIARVNEYCLHLPEDAR